MIQFYIFAIFLLVSSPSVVITDKADLQQPGRSEHKAS
uniref:Myostatin n=1 Tax=Anguilla anguilla TaxID=7936 RepID=A0A0E9PTD6_ANGAN